MELILIVDDNSNKLDDLKRAARKLFPEAKIAEARCQYGIVCAIQCDYWEELRGGPEECLLILDMQMPYLVGGKIEEESGMEVLDWLQQEHLRCPVIITSSGAIDEDRARATYGYYKGFVRYSVLRTPTGDMKRVLAEYLTANK